MTSRPPAPGSSIPSTAGRQRSGCLFTRDFPSKLISSTAAQCMETQAPGSAADSSRHRLARQPTSLVATTDSQELRVKVKRNTARRTAQARTLSASCQAAAACNKATPQEGILTEVPRSRLLTQLVQLVLAKWCTTDGVYSTALSCWEDVRQRWHGLPGVGEDKEERDEENVSTASS